MSLPDGLGIGATGVSIQGGRRLSFASPASLRARAALTWVTRLPWRPRSLRSRPSGRRGLPATRRFDSLIATQAIQGQIAV